MVAQNVFHKASSQQKIDLWRFADRWNIPLYLPTNFHSDLIAKIQQKCLPLLCALLSLSNPICFWSDWCRRAMIPGDIFTRFEEIQGIVSENAFKLPIGLEELLKASLSFLWSFVLHWYDWIHWVATSCTTTACRWLFRDSQLSLRTLWSAVIKSSQFFSTRYGSTIASPARCPCNFCPLADLAVSVFRDMSINTVFTQTLTSHECGL